jgi:hypothetical protein
MCRRGQSRSNRDDQQLVLDRVPTELIEETISEPNHWSSSLTALGIRKNSQWQEYMRGGNQIATLLRLGHMKLNIVIRQPP